MTIVGKDTDKDKELEDIKAKLSCTEFFGSVSDEDFENDIGKNTTKVKIKRDTVIFEEGEESYHVYYVIAGAVRGIKGGENGLVKTHKYGKAQRVAKQRAEETCLGYNDGWCLHFHT